MSINKRERGVFNRKGDGGSPKGWRGGNRRKFDCLAGGYPDGEFKVIDCSLACDGRVH